MTRSAKCPVCGMTVYAPKCPRCGADSRVRASQPMAQKPSIFPAAKPPVTTL